MYPLDVRSLMYLHGLQIGDKLRVPIALGVFHYGIYIGDDGHVVHNDKGGGVRLVKTTRTRHAYWLPTDPNDAALISVSVGCSNPSPSAIFTARNEGRP